MLFPLICIVKYFRYELQDRSDIPTNCYLSDWPSQDINPAQMPDMDSAELYEKGSFGRGCEPYAVPFFNTEQFSSKQSPQGTDEGIHVRNID